MAMPKEKRLEKVVRGILADRIEAAVKHGEAIQNGESGDRLWEERNIRDVYNLEFMRLGAAAERAAKASENTTQMLGVVMLVPQMQSADEWEAFARDEGAIETEAKNDRIPEEDLPRPARLGEVQSELRSDIPVEARPEPTTEGEANGQKRQRRRRQKGLLTDKGPGGGGS